MPRAFQLFIPPVKGNVHQAVYPCSSAGKPLSSELLKDFTANLPLIHLTDASGVIFIRTHRDQ